MKRIFQFAAALLMLVVMAACSSGPKDPFYGLIGNWEPTKVSGVDEVIGDGRTPEILFFADGRVRGYTGMNDFSGSFTVDPAQIINFSHFRSTLKGGTEAVMAFERAFNLALNNTKSFKVADNILYLYGADEAELMVLRPKVVPSDK